MLRRILQILYVLACLIVLIATLTTYAPGPNSDIMKLFIVCMLALGFPSSLLVSGIFTLLILLQEQFNGELLKLINDYVGITLLWIVFVVVGYWQWFLALPWFWRKLKTRKI